MDGKPEKLRSCLKQEDNGNGVACAEFFTPKTVSFATVDEVKEFTPTLTDDSFESVNLAYSPTVAVSSHTPECQNDLLPFGNSEVSPAQEIEIQEEILNDGFVVPETIESVEQGIDDMNCVTLNETADDSASCLLLANSGTDDMSLTLASNTPSGQDSGSLLPALWPNDDVPDGENFDIFAPEIDIIRASLSEEKNPTSCSNERENRNGIFRIKSPFSMKAYPSVYVRPVQSGVLQTLRAATATAVTQTSPLASTLVDRTFSSEPGFSESNDKLAAKDEMKAENALVIPSIDNGECGDIQLRSLSGTGHEPITNLNPIITTRKPRKGTTKTTFTKGAKDPLKVIQNAKVKKNWDCKRQNARYLRSHFENLVERFRSVEVNEEEFLPGMLSPQRSCRHPNDDSPEPEHGIDSFLPKRARREGGGIYCETPTRPGLRRDNIGLMGRSRTSNFFAVKGASQIKIITASQKIPVDTLTSEDSHRQHNQDELRTVMLSEVEEIKRLKGIEKVRKLDMFSQRRLRRLDDDDFEWGISKLLGFVHPDYIAAEEKFRQVQRLVQNPTCSNGDVAEPMRIFAKMTLKKSRASEPP